MRHTVQLQDSLVTLRPLALFDASDVAALADAEALRYHTRPLPLTTDLARAEIRSLLEDATIMPFAVTGTVEGELRGITSFHDPVQAVPRVEIGHTFYGRRYWSGQTNPRTKLLLLTHAFEDWACERVALRCDADNHRSVQAVRRLGAQPEGVLRRHRRRHDGTVADTAYFSVVRSEWPHVRRGLLERIQE